MSLILSILAGLLGSLFGSAARAGTAMARARLEGEEAPDMLNINGSPVAGVVGGVVGSVLGVRTAFWLGAVLGAAGMDRFDAYLLRRVGIDIDALVAKATEAARAAQSAAAEAADAAEQRAVEMADSAEDAAEDAGAKVKSAAEEAAGEAG
ncbi:MAG TPA: hypothetical protein VIC83_01370 [Candidatus Limnocylindria bacterium]|jgi:hypothetical protein